MVQFHLCMGCSKGFVNTSGVMLGLTQSSPCRSVWVCDLGASSAVLLSIHLFELCMQCVYGIPMCLWCTVAGMLVGRWGVQTPFYFQCKYPISRATDNGKWLLFTCPTVQYFHTLYTSSSGPGLTSYCKLSMTLLALLAVEVVHVGTCLHSFVKAGIVKAYEDYRADSC